MDDHASDVNGPLHICEDCKLSEKPWKCTHIPDAALEVRCNHCEIVLNVDDVNGACNCNRPVCVACSVSCEDLQFSMDEPDELRSSAFTKWDRGAEASVEEMSEVFTRLLKPPPDTSLETIKERKERRDALRTKLNKQSERRRLISKIEEFIDTGVAFSVTSDAELCETQDSALDWMLKHFAPLRIIRTGPMIHLYMALNNEVQLADKFNLMALSEIGEDGFITEDAGTFYFEMIAPNPQFPSSRSMRLRQVVELPKPIFYEHLPRSLADACFDLVRQDELYKANYNPYERADTVAQENQ